jgi:hypothetical protein
LSSTGHAFQIGNTTGNNLIADINEIQVRNNGAASSLFLNNNGGDITLSGSGVTGQTLNLYGSLSHTGAATLGQDSTTLISVQNSDLRVFWSASSYTPFRIINGISGTSEVRAPAVYDNTSASAANVFVSATNGKLFRSTASSGRWKHDIVDMGAVLDSVKMLRPVTFKFNEDYLPASDARFGQDVPGLIAEEVAEAIPVAAEMEDGVPSDWNIRIMVPILLKAIQELEERLAIVEAGFSQ